MTEGTDGPKTGLPAARAPDPFARVLELSPLPWRVGQDVLPLGTYTAVVDANGEHVCEAAEDHGDFIAWCANSHAPQAAAAGGVAPDSSALVSENRRLREALEFYAEPKNWRTTGHPQIDANDTAVSRDTGQQARAALTTQGGDHG